LTGAHALADLEPIDQQCRARGGLARLADGSIDIVQSGGLFARRGYDWFNMAADA
jgi:hypothetical protein